MVYTQRVGIRTGTAVPSCDKRYVLKVSEEACSRLPWVPECVRV